jgi:hypothetical protein
VSRWNHLLGIITGRGLDTRDRAGRIFAVLLGTSIILITCAAMFDGLRAPKGLTDPALTLLLGVLTLLVGLVSGYLARVHDNPPGDNRAPVGTIMTAALGTSMVIITSVVLWDAIAHPESRISANTVSLLTAILGGGIGATASYLGLPRVEMPRPAPGTVYPPPVPEKEIEPPPPATPPEP